jgi:hypothetical protein
MDPALRNALRQAVLEARQLLEKAVAERLEGRFDIQERAGRLVADPQARLPHLDDAERALRADILQHFADLNKDGIAPLAAYRQLVREAAFTWLNRFVAFKMLEARKLIRETIARWDDSNGYKHWLAEHNDDYALHQRGGEDRDAAYHRFLLHRCGELAREIRVLFDPDSLPSRLAPPPRILKQLADRLHQPDLADAWKPGHEETLGWVYQFFVEAEKDAVFDRLFKHKQKISPEDLPAATQVFTPNWMVRFLVHNTLGRLWLELHPDSRLAEFSTDEHRFKLTYLVPSAIRVDPCSSAALRSVKDIRLLDPACGTMHFGLVAFDLFVEMYREEMERAGQPGWPSRPPVEHTDDIPAAILAHNLHGIDLDLRAVQIAALALYLKAKTLSPKKPLAESRLACANVHMLDGDRLGAFLKQAGLEKRPIYSRILHALREELQNSEHLGSLTPLEQRIHALVEAERQRYEKEGRQPDLFGWSREQFDTEAGRREFWDMLETQIAQALDAFARDQAEQGVNQTFFAGETVKGLRLLELLAQRYDVVVTNPPYMSARNMNGTLKNLVAQHYPEGKGDLYAAFLQRCCQLLGPSGRMGLVSQQSFMFISSYEKLRDFLTQRCFNEVMAHVGPRAFEEIAGEKVNTTLIVLKRCEDPRQRREAVGTYFRLVKEPDADSKRRRFEQALPSLRSRESDRAGQGPPVADAPGSPDPCVFRYRQADFDAIPGSPWVYWITPGLRRLFETLPKLGDVAQPRQGLATADNFRFLRFWWEVGQERIAFGCKNAAEAQKSRKRWFPYMKGGAFRRWYGNQEYVVNWENDGKEMKEFEAAVIRNPDYYFRRGVTWTALSAKGLSCRIMPEGFIIGHKGPAVYSDQPRNLLSLLAILNSTLSQALLQITSPTIMFEVGQLAMLPIPQRSSARLEKLVEEAIELAQQDSREDETTWDFVAPPPWPDGVERVAERHRQLAEIERQIDEEVYRLYGIADADRAAIEAELAEGSTLAEDEADPAEPAKTVTAWTGETLAQAWLSWAVGQVFAQEPFVEAGKPLAEAVLKHLEARHGDHAAEAIVAAACGPGPVLEHLADDLREPFFQRHLKQYRKRPIYWLLQSAKKIFGVWLFARTYHKDTLFQVLLKVVEPRMRLEESRLDALRSQKAAAGNSGREAKRLGKEIDKQEELLGELRDFAAKLRQVANLHLDPDPNDGVALNIAPLWELVPFKEAKTFWEELHQGKYEWSSIGQQLRKKGRVK